MHREMHTALSLLPRRTQQLRETGETGANLRLKYRKEVREGGKYAKESCVLQGIKRMEKGSRNRRKAKSENISLYATLQEPEFKCFTLNS